jgi:MraZ protein
MFLGQYERTLDDKSRLAIPNELLSGLGERPVLARSFDKCLCMYPSARWESLAIAFDDLPDMPSDGHTLARAVFAGAVPCDLDKQGRVNIPAFLREHAGLSGDAIVLGVNSRVEIWDRQTWAHEQQRFETQAPDFSAVLSFSGA